MTQNDQTVILIPARAGSTRVTGKNIRDLGGKPLLAHMVEAAVAARCGRVIVSTDSEPIAQIARAHGAETPFLRPAALSTEVSSSISVLLHSLRWFRDNHGALPQFIGFCPPTNPFTRADTIAGTCRLIQQNDRINSAITIYEPDIHPFSYVQMNSDRSLKIDPIQIDRKNANNVERSQDLPQFWLRSGNCSATRSRFFVETFGEALVEESADYIQLFDVNNCVGYEIPANEACDIDTPEDFERAERMFDRRSGGFE